MKRLTIHTIKQYFKDSSLTADWDDESKKQFIDELIRLIKFCESGTWETAVLHEKIIGANPKVTYCSYCNSVVTVKTDYCPFCGERKGDEK